MLVAAQHRHGEHLRFWLLTITGTRIQHLDPLQYLPNFLFMRPHIADDSCSNGAGNTCGKFQSTPAASNKMLQQQSPRRARFGNQQSSPVPLLFQGKMWERNTRYNAAYSCICEQNI